MLGWTTSSSRISANTDLCNDVNKVTTIFSKRNKTEIKYDNIVYISNIKNYILIYLI